MAQGFNGERVVVMPARNLTLMDPWRYCHGTIVSCGFVGPNLTTLVQLDSGGEIQILALHLVQEGPLPEFNTMSPEDLDEWLSA